MSDETGNRSGIEDERWKRIDQLLEQALELEASERASFLEKACGEDAKLRAEIEELLAAHEGAGSFMASPAVEIAAKGMAKDKVGSLVGRRLGPYEVNALLGAGGMGEVYRARDMRLDRAVALKILPPEFASDEERMLRFRREAKAASALNHPNVATIHDVGDAGGIQYIVMEYVEGKTLDALIGRKGMRLNDALKYGVQIADALAAAHEAGIVHRDLKPGNLMVTGKGQVKVLDFGLAKLRERVSFGHEESTATVQPTTEEGKIVGTMAYMSPEQAEGKKVDVRSDIVSLGSVLYEMVTGRRAFGGDSKISTLSAILHQEPKPVSAVAPVTPADHEKLIGRCLRKDPERRIQHMDDVKLALVELKEDSDSGRLQVAPAVVTRVSPARLAVVAFAVIALIVAGWYWLGRRRSAEPEAVLTPVPLTSYPGYECTPSFSPDGTQVAFQWGQEGQKSHIYIKQVGEEPPFPLTNAPANDWSPAWSPDGRSIAFIRELASKKWALTLTPQRGGRERQLETWDVSRMSSPPRWPYLAWTPDSKWLAFPYLEGERRSQALFLISVETGEKRRLTTALAAATGETAPAFSSDGRILAFSRYSETASELYLQRLLEGFSPQGDPERVDTGNPRNLGAAWTPDGQEIMFSSGSLSNCGLWRMQVSKLRLPVRVGFAPDHASAPSISKTAKRLAYVVEKNDSNIWRLDLPNPGQKPGRPVPLISSTRDDYRPAFSPDGRKIAFTSERSGAYEIWACDADGSNPVQLTSLGTIYVNGSQWSPDGQDIAFYAGIKESTNVYVVSAAGGTPRRLTTYSGLDQWPFWSRDGRWLYFVSDRGGQREIWKMPSLGGEAIQVTRTKEGADIPQESPDGRFLCYCMGWPHSQSIWRIPVEGGEETKVVDSIYLGASWTVARDGLYFLAAPDDRGLSNLCVYEFSTGKILKILKTERRPWYGIAVSPGCHILLYSQIDEAGSDLMLVENFR